MSDISREILDDHANGYAKFRGGASPEKVGWKGDRIDGQKVYLMIFMSFLLRNEYRPQESGVDMSTPVHPVAPPLAKFEVYTLLWITIKTHV